MHDFMQGVCSKESSIRGVGLQISNRQLTPAGAGWTYKLLVL